MIINAAIKRRRAKENLRQKALAVIMDERNHFEGNVLPKKP
jgi:hypothetical protein